MVRAPGSNRGIGIDRRHPAGFYLDRDEPRELDDDEGRDTDDDELWELVEPPREEAAEYEPDEPCDGLLPRALGVEPE